MDSRLEELHVQTACFFFIVEEMIPAEFPTQPITVTQTGSHLGTASSEEVWSVGVTSCQQSLYPHGAGWPDPNREYASPPHKLLRTLFSLPASLAPELDRPKPVCPHKHPQPAQKCTQSKMFPAHWAHHTSKWPRPLCIGRVSPALQKVPRPVGMTSQPVLNVLVNNIKWLCGCVGYSC